jgi:hypothetical protein
MVSDDIDHESDSDADTLGTVCLPAGASKGDKLAFSQCDLYEQKGSSWRCRCNLCGLVVTTSSHKLIHGHYLQQAAVDIKHCLARSKLQADHAEFFDQLTAKEEKLRFKRQ